MQNHVIDPTFFYDAIEQFAFNYEWYVYDGIKVDDMFRQVKTYSKHIIRGSLQPEKSNLNLSNTGNTVKKTYNFYCKSLYRINIGDFIFYNNRFLHVDGLMDYDEYGVRSCTLTMINLNDYKDFNDYLKYLNGDKLV